MSARRESDLRLAVVGISHHTAPVEVRERFAFGEAEASDALLELSRQVEVREAVLLSTCNRTELYVHGDRREGVECARQLLERRARAIADNAGHYLYSRTDGEAVRHLFRVVTSLDSMVLGEAQIQGQVKGAYESARSLTDRVTGPVLSRLFEQALGVGARVRAGTGLGTGAASVPSAAVQLSKKIFGSLEGRSALIIGAGEMAEITVDCLRSEGVTEIVIASRTTDRAEALSRRAGGTAIQFDDVPRMLPRTDIVATATSAPHPVITTGLVRGALPKKGARSPLCIIDMGLPRDVEPTVGDVHNVFLYDLDDLRQIVDDNLARRRAELPRVESMIEDAVEEYWRWYSSRHAGPVIRALRERAERRRRAEVERLLRGMPDLSEEDRDRIDALTRRMMNRLLHVPTVRLREAAAEQDGGGDIVHAARYLFALEEQESGDNTERSEDG